MKQKTFFTLVLLLSALFTTSCSDHDGSGDATEKIIPDTIAVLCNKSEQFMYENVLKMFNKNALEASQGDDVKLQLALRFVDIEKQGGASTCVQPLFRNENIAAFIVSDDERDNEDISLVYRKLTKNEDVKNIRPLIFPLPTSSNLQRNPYRGDYAWFLSCNSINEADCQMRYVKSQGKKRVVVIASNDDFGVEAKSHLVQAARANGLAVDAVSIANDALSEQVRETMCKAYNDVEQHDDCAVVVASSNALHYTYFDQLRDNVSEMKAFGTYVFSHNACSPQYNSQYKNAVGTTLIADRNNGFANAYKSINGSEPCYGEAQLYDALMLAYLAIYAKKVKASDPNMVIRQLLTEKVYDTWQTAGIRQAQQYLASKVISRSAGAMGDLLIDSNYTNLIKSDYCIWTARQGQFSLDFSYDGSTIAIDESNDGENWALVVCGSYQWEEYRHVADALNVINMLLDKGYKRDHIVTVVEADTLLDYYRIPRKGELPLTPDGKNIYDASLINYHAYQFNPDRIADILTGDETLPYKLNPGPKDNVFIFWSGHGDKQEGLVWMGQRYISKHTVNEWITKLKQKGVNRVMMAIEACFSGQIAEAVNQDDVFVIAAAQAGQESFVYENENTPYAIYGYMQDAFSHAFVDYVTANPKASLYDLYNAVYMNVGESNVTISNPAYYGSLKSRSISDFLP